MFATQKLITLFFLIFIFSGCSSSSKKTTPDATPAASKASAKVETPPTKAQEIKCTSGKDTRIISVQPQGAGCQVVYTKHTEISPIANSLKGLAHCEQVAQKMRLNLEGAGFKCQ